MYRLLLATAIVTLFLPSTAWAHALGASWEIAGDKLKIEGYYSDNTPARKAIVKLLAGTETIGQGNSDDRGICLLPCPKPGTYRIVVETGDGHRAERKVVVPAAAAEPSRQAENQRLPLPPIVSDGPSRQEFTSYHWLKVCQGLGYVGLLALAIWVFLRRLPATRTP